MPDSPLQSFPRILLIDDDPISREVLSMLLEMEGYRVSIAEDGQQALDILKSSEPEVILMDTQMPGLSGLALIQALRAETNARIFAISGSEAGHAIREASDGFLLKPIDMAALRLALQAPKAETREVSQISAQAAPGKSELSNSELILIDGSVLCKLRAMMPAAAVIEIYTAVAGDLKIRLDALKKAMDASDEKEVVRIAHSIKGGCAMVGLQGAMQAAARLESSNLREAWPKELLQLQDALKRLQSILVDGLL